MALEMKSNCQQCNAPLADDSEAYICSYECTYCPSCTEELERACGSCRGELVRRPVKTRCEICDPSDV